jgi:hypothetical protein
MTNKVKQSTKELKELIDINYINNRIKNEFCNETLEELSDEKLLVEYEKCPSVKKNISKLVLILNGVITTKTIKNIIKLSKKNNKLILDELIENKIKKPIINKYLPMLIPPGTKGVKRGLRFNSIVENKIKNINLDKKRFEICFEKNFSQITTTEKPDWYILDKNNNKVLIGMNQLDLWNGGQQLNRGSKYLIDNKINSNNSKLLCVVCNKITLKKDSNKIFELFKIGFENDTLCYINNLQNIINKYFN